LTELRIDRDYLRMIVDYYDRKCPCWRGTHACPCPPFAQTKNCKCGAIRKPSDPKAQDGKYELHNVDFRKLVVLVEDHKCPSDQQTCFCREFLQTGNCKAKVFQSIS